MTGKLRLSGRKNRASRLPSVLNFRVLLISFRYCSTVEQLGRKEIAQIEIREKHFLCENKVEASESISGGVCKVKFRFPIITPLGKEYRNVLFHKNSTTSTIETQGQLKRKCSLKFIHWIVSPFFTCFKELPQTM